MEDRMQADDRGSKASSTGPSIAEAGICVSQSGGSPLVLAHARGTRGPHPHLSPPNQVPLTNLALVVQVKFHVLLCKSEQSLVRHPEIVSGR